MPPRRRISESSGRSALASWEQAPGETTPETTAQAVRFALEELGIRAPGRSTEVRVPPYGAVQCIEGLTHRRGTPPNVIETDAETWLGLVTGRISLAEASASGSLRVSGTRSDLTAYLPMFD